MTDARESLLKKLLLGLIAIALLTFLFQLVAEYPLTSATRTEAKNDDLRSELYDLESDIEYMEEENDSLREWFGDGVDEYDFTASNEEWEQTHWSQRKYLTENEETVALIKEEIKQLKKDPLVVSVQTPEEKMAYVYTRLENKVYDDTPIFGSQEPHSLGLGKDAGPHEFVRNNNLKDRTHVYFAGPWAVVVQKNQQGISKMMRIVALDEQLNISADREPLNFEAALKLREGDKK